MKRHKIKLKSVDAIIAESNYRKEREKSHRRGIIIVNATIACTILIIALFSSMANNHLSQKKIDMLTNQLVISEKTTEHFMNKYFEKRSIRVKVTGYHPSSGGINSDSNPEMTSTMTTHKAGYTCAISTKLVEEGWLGNEIYIEGFGMVLANDRLAKGIKGYQIDLCKGSYNDAIEVGVNHNVLATLVSRKSIKEKLEEN